MTPQHRVDLPSTLSDSQRQLVWQMYEGLSGDLRHFNQLQSTYRSLASTWLLAAFAGAGFVLEKLNARLALVGGIGCAASLGVLLLWLLDQGVYHRLLRAVFRAQAELENLYPWLPRVCEHMEEAEGSGGVGRRTTYFYVAGVAIPAIAAVVAFFSDGCNATALVVLLIFVAAVLMMRPEPARQAGSV